MVVSLFSIFCVDFFFYVPVPPRIGPIAFGELIEGIRTQVQCVIQAGDQPMSLKWLKDDETIPTKLGIQIIQDTYWSTLAIPQVGREHTGNYSCIATNAAKSAQATAVLVVSGNVTFFTVSTAQLCLLAPSWPLFFKSAQLIALFPLALFMLL